MILTIASFCDSKFEYKPGVDANFNLDAIRLEFGKGKVIGDTSSFCTFLMWQLKRYGYRSKIWKVADFSKRFYVLEVNNYFVSYYDGRLYLKEECPWKLLQYTRNLKEWFVDEPKLEVSFA